MTAWLFVALLLHAAPADKNLSPEHQDAMRRARVWEEPDIPVEEAKLDRNPDGSRPFDPAETVECRFKPGGVAGSTPKFDCEFPDGDIVKIKYGRSNPEVYTEVAATRLLAALGFPTDRMYVVRQVRCFGCPPDPFAEAECASNKASEGAAPAGCFEAPDYSRAQTFADAVIERPLKGRRIESAKTRGWSWEELKLIDPAAGGSSRAEVDAFRLMAIVLGHWDNKPKNQRLVCRGEKKSDDNGCEHPLAMVQDVGATFGPMKLNLAGWSRTRVWADAASCRVSMKTLPYGGSTFPDAFISEAGRQFLADRLTRLSAAQIRGLFEGARIPRYPHRRASARSVDNWVRAFQAKVRAIVDRQPCPPEPATTDTHNRPEE